MAAPFHVTIVLPSKVAYEAEASSLIVPAYDGYLGVLAHHAPIVAQLKPGLVTLHDSLGKTINFSSKSNGFLEFSENKATILVDSLDLPA